MFAKASETKFLSKIPFLTDRLSDLDQVCWHIEGLNDPNAVISPRDTALFGRETRPMHFDPRLASYQDCRSSFVKKSYYECKDCPQKTFLVIGSFMSTQAACVLNAVLMVT